METLLNEWLTQWQRLTQQSLQRVGEASAAAAQATGAQFFAGQQQWLRLLALANEAWLDWQKSGGSPQQWQTRLDGFADQLRSQLTVHLASWQSAQRLHETWQLYTWSWQQLSQPWLAFFSQPFAMATPATDAADREADTPVGAAFMQGWDQMLGAPSLGLLRDLTNRQKHVFALWQAHQQAVVEYQSLTGNVWIDAFQNWMERLVAAAQAGQPLTSHRQLLDTWIEVADACFLELFQSDAYGRAQGQLLNTGMALRREQRLLTETWLRLNDLPTQSDLDEAHRQLYLLRKEVKALKKTLASVVQPVKPAPPAGQRRRRTPKP